MHLLRHINAPTAQLAAEATAKQQPQAVAAQIGSGSQAAVSFTGETGWRPSGDRDKIHIARSRVHALMAPVAYQTTDFLPLTLAWDAPQTKISMCVYGNLGR
jgi:hypothetical protein